MPPEQTATLFSGGAIWTGSADTDALLVVDGVVRAIGDQAHALAAETSSVVRVDLDGGIEAVDHR